MVVSKCAECPFAWDGTDMGDRWRCTAVDFNTHYKALPQGNPWRNQPPNWCPLEKASRLVVLRRAPVAASSKIHKTIAECDKELTTSGPSGGRAVDGERWTCSCGRVFAHVCDEAQGCSWDLVRAPRVARSRSQPGGNT